MRDVQCNLKYKSYKKEKKHINLILLKDCKKAIEIRIIKESFTIIFLIIFTNI